MSDPKAIEMILVRKLVLILMIGYVNFANAQVFNVQFFFEGSSQDSGFTLGNLFQRSDSLAAIEFRSSNPQNRAFFACRYTFLNDTLYLYELEETIEIERIVELGPFNSAIGSDSLYLLFHEEESFNSKSKYQNVFFEINGQFYYKSNSCYSGYCAIALKPKEQEFKVKVWDGTELIETFDVEIYSSRNMVSMSKLYFGSSSVFQSMDYYETKFPSCIEYNGKEYVLKVNLLSENFHNTKPSVSNQW